MKHFIYKVETPSGKYYIGRHSTEDVNDGYVGSGRWVRQMKDKSQLTKTILLFCESFEELLHMEKKMINDVIDDPLNMNYNNQSVGAATGKHNVAHRADVKEKSRIRMTLNNHMTKGHSDESKQKISESLMGDKNPFFGKTHTEETKEKIRKAQTGRIWKEEHRQYLSEVRKKQFGGKRPEYLKRTTPLSVESHERLRLSALNREKKSCPHCGLVCAPNTAKRWHFDNCKRKEEVI
jgi:hypothetical protein